MREELLAARALVLPSFAEGLPVVIMEAMALRRPVLRTYIAGIPSSCNPGENGWLFPAGSIEEFIGAMEQCLRRPMGSSPSGRSRLRRVITRHSIDTEASKLAACSLSIVGCLEHSVDILLGGAAVLLLIPVLVVLAEVLLAGSSASAWPDSGRHPADRPRLAVLVPAHNEALGIADAASDHPAATHEDRLWWSRITARMTPQQSPVSRGRSDRAR